MGMLPAQEPDAVHAVALVLDQVKVELDPLATEAGLAVMMTVAAGAVTETVADWVALPPEPVHVNV
jgi:GH18 family chitinase